MLAKAPEIHVLDKHTAELIAAGEVVERPASVIKELVENSIDALASAITVEIASGGISLMRVTDNGCGIRAADVSKAFLRHSTSKIRTGSDLNAIGTLGFRGEALASVAAVSKVELMTRAAGEELGTRYQIAGGEEISLEEMGCPEGTTIIVRDLFYNTPARMKFLKRDVAEGTAVAAMMDRIALSHPEISFRLIREGKEVLLTPGDCKLSSAIYAVYGKEFASGLIPVEYELGGIHVSGCVSKPSACRPNRNMQHFYINDRYVRSRTMMAALEAAYKGSVMGGKFPSCILTLGIAFDQVDVNVHPAKLEVRFSDERPVFDAVYYGTKSALAGKDSRPEMRLPEPVSRDFTHQDTGKQLYFQKAATNRGDASPLDAPRKVDEAAAFAAFPAPKIPEIPRCTPVTADFPASAAAPALSFPGEDAPLMAAEYTFKNYRTEQNAPVRISRLVEPNSEPVSESTSPNTLSDPPANSFLQGAEDAQEEPVPVTLLGEAFGAYSLLEVPGGLLFIDKHAAHERILYNRLRGNPTTEAQMLLSPVTVTLPKEEYGALTQELELVSEAGFEIEDFGGGTVLVRSVPALLSGEDIPSLIAEIAEGFLRDGRLSRPQRLEDILHSVACKAAVKAGQKSDPAELLELAREIFASEEVRYCPHGRPVAFLLRRREIDRQFGR